MQNAEAAAPKVEEALLPHPADENYKKLKADLEYVSHRWRDINHDLWEEVGGRHLPVKRRGSVFSSNMLSATILVKDTSAVGISQWPVLVRNRSSANLGRFPVPKAAASRTR